MVGAKATGDQGQQVVAWPLFDGSMSWIRKAHVNIFAIFLSHMGEYLQISPVNGFKHREAATTMRPAMLPSVRRRSGSGR